VVFCFFGSWQRIARSSTLSCYVQLRFQTTVTKMAYELTEQKKVGLGLFGFGLSFTFLGVILYFDRGLLALGNLFWLIGVGLLLGWQSTWGLFTNVNNLRGTVCFVLGIFLIFVRWPIIGIALEIYGCIVLFGGFWSTVKAFLSQIPFVGWIIQYPIMVLEQLIRGSR
ncbi:unnamed protein product, partial [Thlaspi arvense]